MRCHGFLPLSRKSLADCSSGKLTTLPRNGLSPFHARAMRRMAFVGELPERCNFRRNRSDGARFFFSGAAVELFKTLVQFYGASPCRRPTASRHTVRLVPERVP